MVRYSWKISKSNFFCAIVKIILDSTEPIALLVLPKYILDALESGAGWDTVFRYALIYIATFSFYKLSRMLYEAISAHIVNGCDMKNGMLFTRDYLNMDYKNLEDDVIRNLNQRVRGNIHANMFIYDVFVNTLSSFFKLLGYTYIISTLHPLIIVILIALIGIRALIAKKKEKLNYSFEPISARFGRQSSYLFGTMINFDYAKEVRINNAGRWLQGKYNKTTEAFMAEDLKIQRRHILLNVFASFASFVETVITYIYTAILAVGGSITIGSFSVYYGAVSSFSSAFSAFISALINNSYVMKRIDDYKEYKDQIIPEHSTTDPESSPELTSPPVIEFKGVTFRYPKTEIDVLKNVNLKIEGGKRLAIVGYNGAGKSTLIKLLCRLYEPCEGIITYNGINIKDIRYSDYMEILSVVFQDFKLFSFSVAENVILKRGYDKDALNDCIEKCGLSEKVDSLPGGVDTMVGREFDETGIEFSGGEGQKLASARALYKGGTISVMDEPTSALDPVAENELYLRFDRIISGKTAFYISHRLASARFCDRVAVFASGEIVEEGTHDELMEKGGVYAEMFNKQSMYYRDEVSV